MHTVLTPAVLEAERHYYNQIYDTSAVEPESEDLREQEKAFIEERDSFYMATIIENGWPYVQHRGGPVGFARVLGPRQFGFADYRGNRQLISVGSISKENRISIFMMDYPRRQRLKILGHATVYDGRDHAELAAKTAPPSGHAAKVERVVVIDVVSYDWNCPKFITPRFTASEVSNLVAPMKARISELESQITNRTR